MQLQDLIAEVRSYIGQPSPTTDLSDAQITQFLNQAQRDAVVWADVQAPASTITTIAGQQLYDLPAGIGPQGLVRVTYNAPGGIAQPMRFMSWEEFDYENASFTPASFGSTLGYYYYLWAGQIGIYPVDSAGGNTLTLYYYLAPVDMVNGTDAPTLPDQYNECLVTYAVSRCWMKQLDFASANGFMAEYERMKLQLLQLTGNTQRDQPPRVRYTGV